MSAHAPALVLAACLLVSAALGGAPAFWLAALGLAVGLQVRTLWKRYRDE